MSAVTRAGLRGAEVGDREADGARGYSRLNHSTHRVPCKCRVYLQNASRKLSRAGSIWDTGPALLVCETMVCSWVYMSRKTIGAANALQRRGYR